MDTGMPDNFVPPSDNPIQNISAPTAVAVLNGVVVVGPQWHTDSLYYAELVKDGKLIKLTPPSTTVVIRGPNTAGNEILGTTFDVKNSSFVSCEVQAAATPGVDIAHGGEIVRTAAAGNTPQVITLTTDGGAPPAFDSPKNVVARKSDGTLYITDPGYQTDPQAQIVNNHIWRIKLSDPQTGVAFDEQAMKVDGRPNGIAFTKDQSAVYVSFTDPPSKILKFPIGADGELGPGVAFGTVASDALADGLIVDSNDNVYLATKTGIDVFKKDGTKWGHINTTKPVNGMAFGDADMKTIYFTTDPSGLMMVKVKIAGIHQ
jgi:sugar lactone lactonase YvrE